MGMMNFSFFSIVTLALIICQSILFPGFFWFSQCFDILIIPVLYMSLVYSRYGVILAILVIGGIMDSISGVPFFLHIFSYLWVFFIVQLVKQFVFQRSAMFMIVVSLVAVSIQEGLMIFSVFLSQGQAGVLDLDFSLVIRQMIWGMVIIPPGVWVMNVMRQNFFYVIRQFRRDLARKYRG